MVGLPPCEDCAGKQIAGIQVMNAGLQPHGKTAWVGPLANVDAAVCLNCGRIKLLAAQLDKVRKAAEEHPEWFRW